MDVGPDDHHSEVLQQIFFLLLGDDHDGFGPEPGGPGKGSGGQTPLKTQQHSRQKPGWKLLISESESIMSKVDKELHGASAGYLSLAMEIGV